MKRIISVMLMIVICLSCVACSNNTKTKTDENGNVISKEKKEEVLPPDEEALNPVFPTDLKEYRHWECKYFNDDRECVTVEYKRLYNVEPETEEIIHTKDGAILSSAKYSVHDKNGNCILIYSYTGNDTADLIKREFEDGKKKIEYGYSFAKGVPTDWIQNLTVPKIEEANMHLSYKTIFEAGKEIKRIHYSNEEEWLIEEFEYSDNKKYTYTYSPGKENERKLADTDTIENKEEKDPSQKIVYDEYGKIIEEYNDEGQLVKSYDYYHCNSYETGTPQLKIVLQTTFEYTYNSDGLIKQKKKIWSGNPDHAPTITDYIYSANNYLIYVKTYDEDTPTKIDLETVYKYDTNGNKILEGDYSLTDKSYLQ